MTHATPTRPGVRTGVTLIEILVVLAIIGILLALTTAAVQKTAERQNNASSADQVFKLQQALDLEYERIVAKCAADARNGQIPPQLEQFCDGDKARAKAVWTAYQLRLHFPDTFAEANVIVEIRDPATNALVYRAAPLATFNKVRGLHLGGPYLPQEESGALLSLILTEKSTSGGGAFAASADDLKSFQKKVLFNGVELETFADAFKNSVGFKRWAQTWPPNTNELQFTPHVDPQLANSANKDRLDPQNLVFGWSDVRKRALMNQAAPLGLLFNGQNRVATVYSVAKDKTINTADDILGFRLRRQGNKGNIP